VANVPAARFHDLRHTAASLMLLGDVNVKVVSERLGHANIQLTLDTYRHVLPGTQQVAAQRMDAFFRRKTGS
jgi:integrase